MAVLSLLLGFSTTVTADDDDDGDVVYGAVGCPIDDHDVVVADIAALRAAVATAPPGTVIGVDGVIDVDDGNGDILIFGDGIHLTCASEGAAIVGAADQGLIQFVGSDATISHLIVTATNERGVIFFADGGTASHNTISCVRTCLFFQASYGIAEYNDISQGEKVFGIVSVGDASGITIRKNLVANCTLAGFGSTCIWLFTEDSEAIGNRIWNSSSAVRIGASRNRVRENEVSDCEFCIVGGFELQDVEITKNYCNSPEGPGFDESSVCVQMNGINENLLIADNHLVGNARVNNGGFGERVPNLVFKDNVIEQGILDLDSLVDATIEGNHMSNCAGNRPTATCLRLANSTTTVLEDNTFAGGPGDIGAITVSNFDPADSVSVIDNDINIASVTPPGSFDQQDYGIDLFGSNFFIEDNEISVTDESERAIGIGLRG